MLTIHNGFAVAIDWFARRNRPATVRRPAALFLAFVLMLFGNKSHGEADLAMVQMVTETILANFNSLKSYEAEYQIESFDTLPIQGKH